MKSHLWPLIAGISILLAACNPTQKKVARPAGLIVGLATPIELNYDTTEVHLTDYFLDPAKLDSLKWPQSLKVGYKDTNTAILIGNLPQALGYVTAWKNGKRSDILIKRSNKKKITFTYNPKGQEVKKIQIMGTFNSWNRLANSFTDDSGVYKTDFILPPGDYEYKLIVNDREITDPSNRDSVSNGMGGWNSVYHIPYKADACKTIYTEDHKDGKVQFVVPASQSVLCFFNNYLIDSTSYQRNADTCIVPLPDFVRQDSGRSFIRVFSGNKARFANDLLIPLQNGKPVDNSSELNRSDWESAVIYFLMIDRFRDGNPSNDHPLNEPDVLPKVDFKGGDVAGITQKIQSGFFDSLGVNTLWISPIIQNPLDAWGHWDKGGVKTKFAGYHGYWPISDVKPDFRFASPDEVHNFLKVAHAANKNVLLDYVANHVHIENPVYKEHPDWFTSMYLPDGELNLQRWDDHRLTTWFDTFLASFDFRKPEVANPMTDSAMVWLTKYHFDGFRHDATKHIAELYWRTLTRKVKEQVEIPEHKRIYQIGETYGSPALIKSYISTGMLNAQFDFNLYDASVSTFAIDNTSTTRLKDVLDESLHTYGYHNLMGNISGNQDRSRFISLADGQVKFDEDQKLAGWVRDIHTSTDSTAYEKLGLLQAFNFSIPGIPVIYYGDEYGMPGANDPDNRRMMQFGDYNPMQKALRKKVIDLIHARRNWLPLIYGDTQVMLPDNQSIAIERDYFGNAVVAVLNKAGADRTVVVDLGHNIGKGQATALEGSQFKIYGHKMEIHLPAYSFDYIYIQRK